VAISFYWTKFPFKASFTICESGKNENVESESECQCCVSRRIASSHSAGVHGFCILERKFLKYYQSVLEAMLEAFLSVPATSLKGCM
jgi:hypothetical protein